MAGIFKAYDIRGIYPAEINEEIVYKVAQAYTKLFNPKGKIVVGMDVRLSSPKLKENVIKGFTDAGINMVDIGIVSTEMFYFTVGNYKYHGGILITASHNPKEYNGLKLVKKGVEPIHAENGIKDIENMINENNYEIKNKTRGEAEKKDVLDDFCNFAAKFLEKNDKKYKILYNPNFGFEGEVIKRFVEINNLNWELIGLNDTPDGNFPKGRPDPFIPENRTEFVARVKETSADFGVAWDADGDRVFFCADGGHFIESYHINHLLIKSILKGKPGEKIVYDPRYTWALIDAANEMKAIPILERVGHSYIKDRMRKENAIFSGESSGHTYFRDFWYSDTGLLPLLFLINILNHENKKLSELILPIIEKYPISGEINFKVQDPDKKIEEIENKYKEGKLSKLDGISIEYPNWRFGVRKSNTEPILRLNVEAKTKQSMEQKRDEIIDIIKE
ncbi:phosphomannomutase/phosphoglucomutase [Candidatus Woesearchaeota archaeon]|nr:phosphomannomutase/phosphoglucomutase [Candidatus Woesearchaeota archaeon]